ncbi:hypothetical protein ACTM9B_13325 [Lachnospiraceae bacterium HCP1S3_A10]
MERLTRRSTNGTAVYATPSGEPAKWENNRHNVLQKLADYEDSEEQGRLIKLPCKVGDVVYRINIGAMKPVIPLRVVEYRFKIVGNCIRKKICCSDDFLCKQPSIIYYAEDIGNKVFLTKAEAEAKLKELRGGENGSME